jgi:ERCC4-type nuclease
MYKMTGSQNRCLLIVEDNAEEVEDSMHIQAARGALLQVTAGWQIPYLFSHGISDTAELIELLLKQENNSLKTREAKLRWGYKPRRANRKQQYLLEGFSGIGPKRAKALLSHFKSLRQIFNATPEDLSKVNGISPSLAAAIDTLLNSSVSKT